MIDSLITKTDTTLLTFFSVQPYRTDVFKLPKMVRTITRKTGRDRVLFFSCGLVFPVPHLLQKVFHIHLFGFHLDHPRMLEHPPWCRSSGWVFLEAVKKEILSAKHGRSDEI